MTLLLAGNWANIVNITRNAIIDARFASALRKMENYNDENKEKRTFKTF